MFGILFARGVCFCTFMRLADEGETYTDDGACHGDCGEDTSAEEVFLCERGRKRAPSTVSSC